MDPRKNDCRPYSHCHEHEKMFWIDVFRDVSQRRSWDEKDREMVREFGRSKERSS
jgi:hypothetical protein